MSVRAGKDNERKWEEYWNSLRAQGEYLPAKTNGEVKVARVGHDSKIGRENLYKNPNIRPKLLAAIEETLIARGSQFGRVAIPITKSRLLDQTMVYTALTRGIE